MLEGKESNLKKRGDEIAYWKSQGEHNKGEAKQLYSQLEALGERCQFYESENKILQRDISNK